MFRRTLAASAAALCLAAAPAHAVIGDATTIDGPSSAIVDLGGVAMAEDGSGGLVYRKLEGGRPQVYAAQFSGGEWRQPQRVDLGQPFDSYWPRIAAGNGGRLVVTWAEEFGADTDRMYSATLDPGARLFQPPVPIDFNLGEATATFPSLAMNRGGAAYLVYRVVRTEAGLPTGYVSSDTRIARYRSGLWSIIGALADRNPAQPVAQPTAANSPKVGVDLSGNAIVAFQEPDDEFVDRIWARRVFGSVPGIALLVSPQSFGEAPLRAPADAFSLDVSGFGQGAVAFRQLAAQGSALPGPRVFVNTIPEGSSDDAGRFGAPRMVEPAGSTPGVPSVGSSPTGSFMTVFGADTVSLFAEGDDSQVQAPGRLDTGGSGVPGDPVVDLSDSTAAAAAWKEQVGGRGGVAILERRADGVPETKSVRAASGGPVSRLELAGSGYGDALVAFQQGGQSFGQIAAAVVDAPPQDFLLLTPIGWIRRKSTRLVWDVTRNAISPVTYDVAVDDEAVRTGLHGLAVRVGRRALPDGRHRVEIVAIDGAGQETVSSSAQLRVDRRRPRVRLARRGRAVTVRVHDATSGVRRSATLISFGDGGAARRPRARHTYARPGVFRVRVRARDRAGNRVSFSRRLRVR